MAFLVLLRKDNPLIWEKINVESKPFLIFRIHDALYAFQAEIIQEIILLPKLKHIAEAPRLIAGFLNFYQEIIPVIDIDICLGYPDRIYKLSDYCIIIKGEDSLFGFIISDVIGVNPIQQERAQNFSKSFSERKEVMAALSFLGMHQDEIVFILNPKSFSEIIKQTSFEDKEKSTTVANINPEDEKIFAHRAELLSKPLVKKIPQEVVPLVIIQYNREYFGVDGEYVKEFCPLDNFTALPTGPVHILGFMNLRGDVIPIMDIWRMIGMQPVEIKTTTKLLVVKVANFTFGIVIDDIVDFVFFNMEEFKGNPLSAKGIQDQYIKNAIRFQNNILGVLDVKTIVDALSLTEKSSLKVAAQEKQEKK